MELDVGPFCAPVVWASIVGTYQGVIGGLVGLACE